MHSDVINLLPNVPYELIGDLYIKISQFNLLLVLNSFSSASLCDCFVVKRTDSYEIYYQLRYMNNTFFIYFVFKILEIPSICDIFPNANWYEREIFGMYKISFINHSNIKPLFK